MKDPATAPTAPRCPNAPACSLWDQVGPDCDGRTLMPKCLVAVHRELAVLQFLARAAAGPAALERANQRLRLALHSDAPRTGWSDRPTPFEQRPTASTSAIPPRG